MQPECCVGSAALSQLFASSAAATYCSSHVAVQKNFSLQALVREAAAAKQTVLKSPKRRHRGQGRQAQSEDASSAPDIDAVSSKLEQLLVSAVRRSRFSERLQDTQRIEDLFEVCLCTEYDLFDQGTYCKLWQNTAESLQPCQLICSDLSDSMLHSGIHAVQNLLLDLMVVFSPCFCL